ncbi:MAG: hypothetical protein QOD63_2779, partial [Actinomycetota bacterium]|nr:hypothetical protein [Actinomycetota bacterium]
DVERYVLQASRVIDLGRPKQRAVLAVLLLSPNRVVSLDRLIELLWGDEAPARAAGALQAYISNLRRALEPARVARTPAQVLVTQPPGYLLRVQPDDVDAARFEALAEVGRVHLHDGRPRAARRALTEALGLWRGPALAEFAFEAFADREASRLEELRIGAAEQRWEAELALRGHAQVVGALEVAVSEHPLRERLWELLVLALYRSGRQGDALRAYDRARTILAEELGLSPSPSLRRLHADVLAQAPTLEWTPTAAEAEDEEERPLQGLGEPAAAAAAHDDQEQPVAAGQPFVGRERELASLESALSGARHGRGRLVLVSGEAGIGKTRLAEELAARAEAQGVPVVWAHAYEGEGAPPFWPWIQAVRTLLERAGTDQATPPHAVAGGGAELAHLVPEIGALIAGETSAPELQPGSARFWLNEAVCDFIRRMTAGQPMVLVLDDLHWADPPSLDLAVHLGLQLDDSPLLVIATFRPEVDPGGPLADALGALARLRSIERLELKGLSPVDTERFLTEAAGMEATPSEAAALHASTNGNPFFLGELSSLLASQGQSGGGLAVPVGVRDVIRSRLARLPERTNALLIVAAVIGKDFDLRVAAAAGRADLNEALDVVEPAVATGIVVEDDTIPGLYRFRHTLVRDTVYADLSGLRRARLHARVAETVADLPDAQTRLSELAFHFEKAAPAAGPEPALHYALLAAEAAQATLAYEAAEGHLRRALTLLESVPAGEARDRQEVELQRRLAIGVTMLGGLAAPGAGYAWSRASELCRRLGDIGGLRSSLLGLSVNLVARAHLEQVLVIGEELLDLGRVLPDEGCVITGHFARGTAAWPLGQFSVAREDLDEARRRGSPLEDASRAGTFGWNDPTMIGSAQLSLVNWLLGDDGASDRSSRRSRSPATRTPHAVKDAIALIIEASLHAMRGDVRSVLARTERLDALNGGRGVRDCEAAARIFHGWALARQGGGEAAVTELMEGLAAHASAGFRVLSPLYRGLLGDAYRQVGRLDDALATVDEALDEVETTGQRFYEAELHRLRGELLLALGHRDEGESSLRRAVEVADDQGAVPFRLRAEDALSRLASASAVD